MRQGSHQTKDNTQNPFSINISFSLNQKSIVKQTQLHKPRDPKPRKIISDQLQILNFQHLSGTARLKHREGEERKLPTNNKSQKFKNRSANSDAALSDRYLSKDLVNEERQLIKQVEQRKLQKRKCKQRSMDISNEEPSSGKPSKNEKSIKMLGKSQFPLEYCVPPNSNKHSYRNSYHQHFYKHSQSQNMRRKSNSSTSNNETSQNQCLYSNSLIRAVLENPTERRKSNSLKNFVNELVRKELSKPTIAKHQSHTRKKSKNRSQTQRQRVRIDNQAIERDAERILSNGDFSEFVNRLSSLKSMESFVLKSEMAEQCELDSRNPAPVYKYVETEESTLLIQEILEFEKFSAPSLKEQEKGSLNEQARSAVTHQIIKSYIDLLNQEDEPPGIGELMFPQQTGNVKVSQSDLEDKQSDHDSELSMQSPIALISEAPHSYAHQDEPSLQSDHMKEKSEIHQIVLIGESESKFYSMDMSRDRAEQSKGSQIPGEDLEKWKAMLSYMLSNINSEVSKKELLSAVQRFLGLSESHIAQMLIGKELALSQIPESIIPESDIINSGSEIYGSQQFERQLNHMPNPFEDGDSDFQQSWQSKVFQERGKTTGLEKDLSPPSEEEEESSSEVDSLRQVDQPNLFNLTMIDKILKNRYNELMERKTKDIMRIEDLHETGKMTSQQVSDERRKIDKWTKSETKHILMTKHNIWKGYNQVKGIMGKLQNSSGFQGIQQGRDIGKKNKMLRCLSDKYIGKIFQLQAQDSENESEQFRVLTKGKREDIGDQAEDDEKDYDKEMSQIKERLLKLKESHLQDEEESSQGDPDDSAELQNSPSMSPTISYQETNKEFPGHNSSSDDAMSNLNEREQNLPDLSEGKVVEIESQNRLRYLCQEDKEDIFEFIFLDVCIEIYQEPCSDNRIMKSVNNRIAKSKKQAKKNKGVRTNLSIVKEYLKRFQSFIFRAHPETLSGLSMPMGPTAYQMLKYMRETDDTDAVDEELSVAVVVPAELFDKFENSLLSAIEFEPYFEEEEREQQRVEFLKSVLHIHNKAIFDALNQSLDHQRPFGLWGAPFPWKNSPLRIRQLQAPKLEDKFKKCCDSVGECCSYVCGLLTDKEESLVGSAHLSEDYLMSIREDRLSRMLANDLIENEERWLFFDDEQAEVLVESARFVLSLILNEACRQITYIRRQGQGEP